MSQRDNQFPATSIGRTQASRLQKQPSQPSPTTTTTTPEAHPLLFGSVSPSFESLPTANGYISAKYVPYTPRHRVAPTVTTGTTVHPSSPQHLQGDATTKLQLTNSKAAAQNAGLDTNSVGWAILEKLVSESETGEQWSEVWSAVTSGKATLLLPAEATSSHDKLTPEFLKDHVILYDGSARKNTPFVTLSGLRGTLNGETLTFYSTLHPSSKLFHDILDPTTRRSTFRNLPPLPLEIPGITRQTYPNVKIITSSNVTTLPLPPRASTSIKPPLPPRPGSRSIPNPSQNLQQHSSSTSTSTSTSSRIPNPFASLFGHQSRPSTPTPIPTPTPLSASVSVSTAAPSPPASIRSLDPSTSDPYAIIDVKVMIVEKKVIRRDVGKLLNKVIRIEIKDSLRRTRPMPPWLIERVEEFVVGLLPFVKTSQQQQQQFQESTSPLSLSSNRRNRNLGVNVNVMEGNREYVINSGEGIGNLEDLAQKLQDFYYQLELDMRAGGTPFLPRTTTRLGRSDGSSVEESQSSIQIENDNDKDKENNKERREREKREKKEKKERDVEEKRELERLESEGLIRDVMENVESTICSLFYDRLFMQPTTDDLSHDEALSNRIAALNMLDLGLEHLDIQVGESSEEEVGAVVRACGEMLSQLNNCRSPSDKSTILVAAHNIVVDGLSRLPPIRLMSEEESKALKERKQNLLKDKDKVKEENKEKEKVVPPVLVLNDQKEEENVKAPKPDTTDPLKTPKPNRDDLSFDSKKSEVEVGLIDEKITDLEMEKQSEKETEKGLILTSAATPTPTKPTPVSGDILLPMIIFAVVKSNPPHLVSNLLFTQRFRNQSIGGGEEGYCLINLMAVAEFLENVDLEGLGLSGGHTVISTADLTPITITRSPATPQIPLPPLPVPSDGILGSGPGLRGRVEQQVDAITGSANKVLSGVSGVVDSSFGILRALLPNNPNPNSHIEVATTTVTSNTTNTSSSDSNVTNNDNPEMPAMVKPGFGLLRRENGFSIANIAAALPISGRSNSKSGEETGQQLITVSRPSSVKSVRGSGSVYRGSDDEDDEDDDEEEEEEEEEEESDENGNGEESDEEEGSGEDGEESDVSEEDGVGVGVGVGRDEEGDGNSYDHRGINIPTGLGRGHSRGHGETSSFGTVAGSGSGRPDIRSIKSFESMLSESKRTSKSKSKAGKRGRKLKKEGKIKNEGEQDTRERASSIKSIASERKSLSDRLASVSAKVFKGSSPPPLSRTNSLLQAPAFTYPYSRYTGSGSPVSSRPTSPSPSITVSPSISHVPSQIGTGGDLTTPLPPPTISIGTGTVTPTAMATATATATATGAGATTGTGVTTRRLLPPPTQRFLECSVEDLKISEVKELLNEYRKLVQGVKDFGGFES